MRSGWIKAWRKLFDREDWLCPTTKHPAGKREAWLDMCQMAQHERYEHAGTRLNRGELVVSVRTLGKRWAWSKSAVSRFIGRLQDEFMIAPLSGTPSGTVYRIVNYDAYAVDADSERDTMRDRCGTDAGQEQELSIKKTAITDAFDEVWAVCRRGSKKQALAQYRKAVPGKVEHDTLLAKWKAHVAAASKPEYVKHLERWIRDERWEEALSNGNGHAQDEDFVARELERRNALLARMQA